MAEPAEPQTPPAPAVPRRPAGMSTLALAVAVIALALAAWQWIESKRGLAAFEQEAARRLAEIEATNRESKALAAQSRDAIGDASARLGQLEARMFETQNQRMALESLYRDFSRGRDEWTLAEVEQALLIANQQLQLAGNVKAALIAMETADTRLARMDRPQLAALRRVINQDMEKLRAAPFVDVVGLALRLDNAIAKIDGLPLAMEQRPAKTGRDEAAPAGYWQKIWREFRTDLRNLVRIQNMENPDVPLVSPDQAFFLRENLRLRLLGARLSLLSHDESSFRADIKAASDWTARYYDGADKNVAGLQSTLKEASRTDFGGRLPDISASLEAARGLRLVREGALR